MSELQIIKSKPNNKKYQKSLERIFGDKPVERGRWIQHPETGKLVRASEYVRPVSNQAPIGFVDNMEAYESPVTGEVITNRRARDYDLKSTGCRPYEGLQSEQKEAARFRQYEKQELDKKIDHTLHKTLHEIEHGYR